jgi:hypothetical protein
VRALLLAVLCSCAAAGDVAAATVSASIRPGFDGPEGSVEYDAADGEVNRPAVREDGEDVVIGDASAPLVAGPGCVMEGAAVRCPRGTWVTTILRLGDRDDAWTGPERRGATVDGGPGDDRLVGRAGYDELRGGDGADLVDGGDEADRLDGGDGRDVVLGGDGADVLEESETPERTAPDRLDGGPGLDGLVFRERGRAGVRVDLAAGTTGGGDAVAGIESLGGTQGRDVLAGSDAGESFDGWSGDDVILGRGGRDRIDGGLGDDGLAGGDGPDELFGEDGRDRLDGGPGDDFLRARGREDRTVPEEIRCGDGVDQASLGPRRPQDVLSHDCETLRGYDDVQRAYFLVPLHPRRVRGGVEYTIAGAFATHIPWHVRIEALDARGRVAGRSRRVRLPNPLRPPAVLRVPGRPRHIRVLLATPGTPRRHVGEAVLPARP